MYNNTCCFRGNILHSIVSMLFLQYYSKFYILEYIFLIFRFATQAKNIKTKPQKNEITSNASLLIRYTKQLKKLQTELEVCIKNDFI